ncbi:hypothetical protein V7184_17220, partial [Bacillus safensis]
ERSEQLTKDQLKEEGDSNTSASNVMPKVDVERSEQLAKDQLKEEGDSNTNASNAIPKVDVERSDQIKEHIAEEEKTNSPKSSTSIHEVDVERSDQGISEKTLTEENISNQNSVRPVPNSNVARNEQIQSEEKVSAPASKAENETVKSSDTQPKTKRVIQQQPKHVKIELEQIESRQSKSDRGNRA